MFSCAVSRATVGYLRSYTRRLSLHRSDSQKPLQTFIGRRLFALSYIPRCDWMRPTFFSVWTRESHHIETWLRSMLRPNESERISQGNNNACWAAAENRCSAFAEDFISFSFSFRLKAGGCNWCDAFRFRRPFLKTKSNHRLRNNVIEYRRNRWNYKLETILSTFR